MKVKEILQIVVETITGRKCSRCKHKRYYGCKSEKYEECCTHIFPIGFERKDG